MVPSQLVAGGAKRPMVEVEMSVDEREPVPSARSVGRSAKRRMTGKNEDGLEERDKERERPGRKGGRKGHGAGSGAAVGAGG